MTFTIYIHTCRVSGKHYIGQTIRGIETRWAEHLRCAFGGYHGNTHLAAAIRKYGSEAWDHGILQLCSTQEEANEAEAFWIDGYGTLDHAKGYNLIPGGMKAGPVSESTRAKMSASQKERFTRPEELEKISKAHLGRVATEETRAKQSASLKAYLKAYNEVNPGLSDRHLREYWTRPENIERHAELMRQRHLDNPEILKRTGPHSEETKEQMSCAAIQRENKKLGFDLEAKARELLSKEPEISLEALSKSLGVDPSGLKRKLTKLGISVNITRKPVDVDAFKAFLQDNPSATLAQIAKRFSITKHAACRIRKRLLREQNLSLGE